MSRIAGNMGYVVNAVGRGAMFCDPRDGLLYFHREVTVFRTRRRAQAAIDKTLEDRPTFVQDFGGVNILPLKPVEDEGSYTVTIDREQAIISNLKR